MQAGNSEGLSWCKKERKKSSAVPRYRGRLTLNMCLGQDPHNLRRNVGLVSEMAREREECSNSKFVLFDARSTLSCYVSYLDWNYPRFLRFPPFWINETSIHFTRHFWYWFSGYEAPQTSMMEYVVCKRERLWCPVCRELRPLYLLIVAVPDHDFYTSVIFLWRETDSFFYDYRNSIILAISMQI